MAEQVDVRDQLKAQFAATGLEIDDATAEALAPVYAGLLNGVRRIAALDLGETEPAMTFRHPRVTDAATERRP